MAPTALFLWDGRAATLEQQVLQRTAPYMHDGSLSTLEQVIEYYDRGGQRNPGLDTRLRPLHLSPAERQDLLAFLGSLAGRICDGR